MKRYLSNNKGQDLVEFAIILGFVIFVGMLAKGELMRAAGALFGPTSVVLAEIDHHRTYGVEFAIKQIESIQQNDAHYHEGDSYNKMDWRRGMLRSGWVDKFADDANLSEIKNLYDEVGASQWSYLNGLGASDAKDAEGNYINPKANNNYRKNAAGLDPSKKPGNNPNKNEYMYIGDKGLYWTNQDLTQYPLTANSTFEKENFSYELVLQYFYSSYTKRYYVIKSHVWVYQGDVANGITLGGLHQQYHKPAGYFVEGCVDGFATLEEAKVLYEKTRLSNTYVVNENLSFNNCVVFSYKEDANPPYGVGEKDISAGEYVLNQDTSGNWHFVVYAGTNK